MKIKLCVSVFSALLLLCGLSAFGQDLNVNGNVNLMSPNYAYQIDSNNVFRVFQTATDGSNLYLGRGAGLNLNGVESKPTRYPNAFLGNFAGRNTQNGIGGNTAVGYAAGSNNVMGNYNTYLGYKAAGAFQANPPQGKSGGSNTIVGYQAGYNTTGGDANTFLGNQAGYSNTQGAYNTFLGDTAGFSNTQGYSNTYLGEGAGRYNTTGQYNTFVGYGAGLYNKTGIFNVYLGIAFGNQGDDAESHVIRIGDYHYQNTAYVAGIYGASTNMGKVVYVDSVGKLGTSPGFDPLAEMQDTIRSQEKRIADLEQRLAQMEVLMEKK